MDEMYGKDSLMLSKCRGNSEQELSKEFTRYHPRNGDMPFEIPILQRHNRPRHDISEKRKCHFSESHGRKTVNMVQIGHETDKPKRSLSAKTEERGHLNTDSKRKYGDGDSHETSSKDSFEMALCPTIPSRPKQRKSSSENECHELDRKHIRTNTKSHDSVPKHSKSSTDKCSGDSKKQTIRNNEKSFGMALNNEPAKTIHKKSSSEKQCQKPDKVKNKADIRLIKKKHAIKHCTVDVVPLKMSHKHYNKDLNKGGAHHETKNVPIERNKHCHSKVAHQERYKSIKSKVDCGMGKNDRTLDKRLLSVSAKHNCNQGAFNEKARNLVIDENDRHHCNRTMSDNSAKHHNSSHERQIQSVKDKYHDIKAGNNNDGKSEKTGVNHDKSDAFNICNIKRDASNFCNIKNAKPTIVADKCVNNEKLLKILKDFNLMDKLPMQSEGDHDVKMGNKISAKERSASVGNEVVTDEKIKTVFLGKHRSNSVDGSESQIKKIKIGDSSTVSTTITETESPYSKNDGKESDKYLDIMNYWKRNIGQKKTKQDSLAKTGANSNDHVSKKSSSKSESVHRREVRSDGAKKSEATKKGKESLTRKEVVGKESHSVHRSEVRNDVAKKSEATKQDEESSTRKEVVDKESHLVHISEVRNVGAKKSEVTRKGKESSTRKEVVGKESGKDVSDKDDNSKKNINNSKKTGDFAQEEISACKRDTKDIFDKVVSMEVTKNKASNEQSMKSDTNGKLLKGMPNKVELFKECGKKILSNRDDAHKSSWEDIKNSDGTKKTVRQIDALSSIEQSKKKAKIEATVVKEVCKSELKKDVSGNGDVSKSEHNGSKSTPDVGRNKGNINNRNDPKSHITKSKNDASGYKSHITKSKNDASGHKHHITKSKTDVSGHKSHITKSKTDVSRHKTHLCSGKSEYNSKKSDINKNIDERSNSETDVNKEKGVVGNSKGFEKVETNKDAGNIAQVNKDMSNKGSPIKKKVAVNWKKCTQLYKQQQQQRRGHHILKSIADAKEENGIVRNSTGDEKIETNKATSNSCKDKNKLHENSTDSTKRHYLDLFTNLKSGLSRLEQEKQSDKNGTAVCPKQTNSGRVDVVDDSRCNTKEKSPTKNEKTDLPMRSSRDNLFESFSRKILSNDSESKEMTIVSLINITSDNRPNGVQLLNRCNNDRDDSSKKVSTSGSINVHQPEFQHTKRRWHSESGLPNTNTPQKIRHSSSGCEATGHNPKATTVKEKSKDAQDVDGRLGQADLDNCNNRKADLTSQMETMCKGNSNNDVSDEHAEHRLTIDVKEHKSVMFRHLLNVENKLCGEKYKVVHVAKDDSISLLAQTQDIHCAERKHVVNAQSECQTSAPHVSYVTKTVTVGDSDSVFNISQELMLEMIDIPEMPATSGDVQDDSVWRTTANVEIPVPQLLDTSDASVIMQNKSSVDECQSITLSVLEASSHGSNDGESNSSNGAASSAEGTTKSTGPVESVRPLCIRKENIAENVDATSTNNDQIPHTGRLENISASDIRDFEQHKAQPTVDIFNFEDDRSMRSAEDGLRNPHHAEDTRNYLTIEDVAIISNEEIPIIAQVQSFGIDGSAQNMDNATISIMDGYILQEEKKQACDSYGTAVQSSLISPGKCCDDKVLSCKKAAATLSFVNDSSCLREKSETAAQDKPGTFEDDLKKDSSDGMFNLEYHDMKDPAYVNACKDDFDADSENDTSTIEYREPVDVADLMSNEEKDYNNKTLKHHGVLRELIAIEKSRGSISTDVANVISYKSRGKLLNIIDDDSIVVDKPFIGINVSSDKEYIDLDEYIDIEALSENNTTHNSSFLSECSHNSDDKQCLLPDGFNLDLVDVKSEALKEDAAKPEENDSEIIEVEKNLTSLENCESVTTDAIKNTSFVIVDLAGSDSEEVGDETVLQTASRNLSTTKKSRDLSEELQNVACQQLQATAKKDIIQSLEDCVNRRPSQEYNNNTNCEIRSCEKLSTVVGRGPLKSVNTISASNVDPKSITLDYGCLPGKSAKGHPDIVPPCSSSNIQKATSSVARPSSSPEQMSSQCETLTHVFSSWHRPSVYNPQFIPEEKYPVLSSEQTLNKVKTSDIYLAQNVNASPDNYSNPKVNYSNPKVNIASRTTIVSSPTTRIQHLETQCSLNPKVVSISSFANSIDEPIEISENSLPSNDTTSTSPDRRIDNQQPVIQPTSNGPRSADCIFKHSANCAVPITQTKRLQNGVNIKCYGVLCPRTTHNPHWMVCCLECRRTFPVNDFMLYHHHKQDVTITQRYVPQPAGPLNEAQQFAWNIYLRMLEQKGNYNGRIVQRNFLVSRQSCHQNAAAQQAKTSIPTTVAATQNIPMNQRSMQRSGDVAQQLLPLNQRQVYPSSNMPQSQTSTANNSCMFQSQTTSQRQNYPSVAQSLNLAPSPVYSVPQAQMLNSGQCYPVSGSATIQTNSSMQLPQTSNRRLSYTANVTSQQDAPHPSMRSMQTCTGMNPTVGSFQNVPYNSNNLNPGHPIMANRQNDQTLFSKQNHVPMASQAYASGHFSRVNNMGEPVSNQPSLVNSCAPLRTGDPLQNPVYSETSSVLRMNNNTATVNRTTYPPAYWASSQIPMPLDVPVLDQHYSVLPLSVDCARNAAYYQRKVPLKRRRGPKKVNSSNSGNHPRKAGKSVNGEPIDSQALGSVSKVTNGCLSNSEAETVGKEPGPLKTSQEYMVHDVPPKRRGRPNTIHSSNSAERTSTGGKPTDSEALASECVCSSGQAESYVSEETDMSKEKDSVDKDTGPMKASQVHTAHAKTYVPCSRGRKANNPEKSLKSNENCILMCSASKQLQSMPFSIEQLSARCVESDTVSPEPSDAMDRSSGGTLASEERFDTSTEKCESNWTTSKSVVGVYSVEHDKEMSLNKGHQIDETSPEAADSERCNESANTVKECILMMALPNDKPYSKADNVTDDAVTKVQEYLESLQAKYDAMKAEVTELRHIVMLNEEGK